MDQLIYTAHARKRMRERRVTRWMVEATLAAPHEPYRRGPIANEELAERRFGRVIVEVVFEERKTDEIVVITVITRRARE